MNLIDRITAMFVEHGWTWSLKGGRVQVPTAWDVERALDEAARVLYNEPVETQLEVGRLIIKKTTKGHDVYMYVGPYE